MFVVIINTPGYLPEDDDPPLFEDRADALEYLQDEVERHCEWLDEIEEPFSVHWSRELDSAFVKQTARTHDLGRSFEIHEAS